MQPKPSIFSPYDPLIKIDPLYIKIIDQTERMVLCLRPVWIIGDLETLHEWLNPAVKKANWELDLNRKTVYQHYKELLVSSHSQSFMVEQNDKPIIQFDLFSLPKSNRGFTRNRQEQDSYLHFLYKENFRDLDIFEKGLQCLMSFLFSQPETGIVYLPVPRPESRFHVAITGLGFEISDIDIPFHTAHQTYQVTRKAFEKG
jgi:hypothetical protein